jgi:transposase
MVYKRKRPIELTEKQRELLLELSKARNTRQSHKQRADIILLTEQGYTQRRLVSELNITHCTVNYWKTRWHENQEVALAYDRELTGSAYRKAIVGLLSDKSRPGCPGKFSAEQICQIMNVACEAPEESGLPLSHWSLSELATELVRRKIVESISTSQLSVFLKSSPRKTS